MYTDVTTDVREALGVSSDHDAVILAAVKRSAKFLLRNFNFPESLVAESSEEIVLGAQEISLDYNVGKIKGVRLRTVENGETLYKVLRRREETVLPFEGGPSVYVRMGDSLQLDTALTETGYYLDFWYQTVDVDLAETWLADTYADVLFHLSALRAAPLVHKPELMNTFAPLWQQDQATLAVYLNELEFEGMDMQMAPAEVTLQERYPA